MFILLCMDDLLKTKKAIYNVRNVNVGLYVSRFRLAFLTNIFDWSFTQ